jgi:hypothetical protein
MAQPRVYLVPKPYTKTRGFYGGSSAPTEMKAENGAMLGSTSPAVWVHLQSSSLTSMDFQQVGALYVFRNEHGVFGKCGVHPGRSRGFKVMTAWSGAIPSLGILVRSVGRIQGDDVLVLGVARVESHSRASVGSGDGSRLSVRAGCLAIGCYPRSWSGLRHAFGGLIILVVPPTNEAVFVR